MCVHLSVPPDLSSPPAPTAPRAAPSSTLAAAPPRPGCVPYPPLPILPSTSLPAYDFWPLSLFAGRAAPDDDIGNDNDDIAAGAPSRSNATDLSPWPPVAHAPGALDYAANANDNANAAGVPSRPHATEPPPWTPVTYAPVALDNDDTSVPARPCAPGPPSWPPAAAVPAAPNAAAAAADDDAGLLAWQPCFPRLRRPRVPALALPRGRGAPPFPATCLLTPVPDGVSAVGTALCFRL